MGKVVNLPVLPAGTGTEGRLDDELMWAIWETWKAMTVLGRECETKKARAAWAVAHEALTKAMVAHGLRYNDFRRAIGKL